jgi:hypothetical protein
MRGSRSPPRVCGVTTGPAGDFVLPVADGRDVSVVGAARGYYHQGAAVQTPAADVELRLEPVILEDDPAYQLTPAATCGGCHVEQYAEWSDSPMQRAGLNTWVYDLYDGTGSPGGSGGWVYTRDSVLAPHNPASECASCHQPERWLAEPFAAMGQLDSPSPSMVHGVTCEVCHRLADIDESKPNYPGLYPGVTSMNRPADPTVVTMYGALGDVDYAAPGEMRASLQPQLAAALCMACHQDKNDPDEDGDFEEADGVISEPTYLEWLASPYGRDPNDEAYRTCVDCHMPPTDAATACSVIEHDPGRPAGQVRSHRIEGTTPSFLQNAASLDVEVTPLPGEVAVTVTVSNDQTGHHLPTGVTVRNVLLLVEAFDAAGAALEPLGEQVLHDLAGVGDPALGYWAGLPGKLFAVINADASGAGPVFFTEAASVQVDTRIPAMGRDVTSYRFAAPDGGEVRVRTRLVYRRAWRAVVDAKGWTTTGHGRAPRRPPGAELWPPYGGR